MTRTRRFLRQSVATIELGCTAVHVCMTGTGVLKSVEIGRRCLYGLGSVHWWIAWNMERDRSMVLG